MSFINFTKLSNGILFDLSERAGAGTTSAKFVFRPSLFHTITKVEVWDARMSYTTIEGVDFNFSFDGVGSSQLKIAGATSIDNYALFNSFIALL